MIRILFVCMGNICRSPMAEAVFQHKINQMGLTDQFEIDSAGTGDWHAGQCAHTGTLNILKKQQIAYDGRARQITPRDLERFDYVLAMDRDNLAYIRRNLNTSGAGSAEIGLFLEHAKVEGLVDMDEVPDPYYNGQFERVYRLVERGSDALLAHLLVQHEIQPVRAVTE